MEVPITPIVKDITSKQTSILEKITPRIIAIIIEIIKEKNEKDEAIGTFLLIKTTRLFPEPKRAIVDETAAIPIKKANSPNFMGSTILAIINQNAIPIA